MTNGHADIAVGVGFGAAGNIRVFSGTTLAIRHEFVTQYTTGVSIALTDYDGDHLPDLVTSHKLSPGGLSGGGIVKGTDFTFFGDWGNTTGFEQSGPTGDLISGWTAP